MRSLLRAADRDGLAVDDLRDLRFRVVQVTVAVSSETPAPPALLACVAGEQCVN
jgi:hypothetical protein